MSIRQGSTIIADTGSSRADKDLSNLTSVGKNITNWSSNVTNCITEIPQDIKLELNSSVLTLKAGSKLYVPNGFEQDGTTPKFDVVTVEDNCNTGDLSSITEEYLEMYNSQGASIYSVRASTSYSGSSAPNSPQNGYCWYDTTNNLVKRYNGSSWISSGFSLPFCILSSGAASIAQVFNGFGYIGSTIFALPGVKGLIPNGRNTDGTLKNTSFTTSSVITSTLTGGSSARQLVLRSNAFAFDASAIYDETSNVVSSGSFMIAGFGSYTSGVIKSLNIKDVFHAVDYTDVANLAMPSGTYDDLTIGANNTEYTAPSNGYYLAQGTSTGASGYIILNGTVINTTGRAYTSNQYMATFLPIYKGHTMKLMYGAMSVSSLKFYYAVGSESEAS